MASDVAALMSHLQFDQFAVVGHDRGCYVASRLALDHPERVSRLAVLDSVSIGEALARARAPASRRPGGTGSSSPSPRYPNGSSSPTRTRGAAPVANSPSTGRTTTPTALRGAASRAPPWSSGPRATTWNSSTVTRSRSGDLDAKPARRSDRQRTPPGGGQPRRPRRRAVAPPRRHLTQVAARADANRCFRADVLWVQPRVATLRRVLSGAASPPNRTNETIPSRVPRGGATHWRDQTLGPAVSRPERRRLDDVGRLRKRPRHPSVPRSTDATFYRRHARSPDVRGFERPPGPLTNCLTTECPTPP